MSFANLKQSRGNFDKLTKELEKVTSPTTNQNSSNDDRFWKPELDKTGNGYAVIRFLPAVEGEEYLGQEFGLMPFKDLAVGILRIV